MKSGCQQPDQDGRESERKRQKSDLGCDQERKDAIAEDLSGRGAVLLANTGIGRNKRCIESPFGKDGPKMIWEPQRNEESIRYRARAEHSRKHDVTRETSQP